MGWDQYRRMMLEKKELNVMGVPCCPQRVNSNSVWEGLLHPGELLGREVTKGATNC